MEEKPSSCSRRKEHSSSFPYSSSNHAFPSSNLGFFHIRAFEGITGERRQLICLRSDRLHTIGRKRRHCQVVFDHYCVSRHHCQIFLDSADQRLSLVDGIFLSHDSDFGEVRQRLRFDRQALGFKASLNGVFVNRRKIQSGSIAKLSEGDEIAFGCKGCLRPGSRCVNKFGFVVESIVLSGFTGSLDVRGSSLTRADSLQILCRRVLRSEDPIRYLQKALTTSSRNGVADYGSTDYFKELIHKKDLSVNDEGNAKAEASFSILMKQIDKSDKLHHPGRLKILDNRFCNGQTFFLNRLELMAHSSMHTEVTLMDLLDPIENLVQIFIATFTCDASWFLSYCKIPSHIPVTIACHNTEKCWSDNCHDRTSVPYSNYPNLMLVFPPFPVEIAFGKDRSKKGVACHHPKLLVLQREGSIRVIVTSANLVSKQWNQITNTVWWQDFPRRDAPDYASLFTTIADSKSDFAAQLAGFMSSLIADVPSQAHWIKELSGYDFGGAAAYLIASIPGMHTSNFNYSETDFFQPFEEVVFSKSTASAKHLGSVQAAVVGLSHRFHNAADLKSEQLRKLASFIGQFHETSSRIMEVVLKRNHNIPADANAISIFVSNSDEVSNEDSVQLGFLPREVAKWAAPLIDNGFIEVSAFVNPKEFLSAAADGTNTKVQCLLSIMQGPKFSEISRLIKPEHFPALCLFIASIQRCLGLWRLKEVMSRCKWPELLETDFSYASSSIGTSMNPQFLAAFSAAAGKKSFQLCESEESDSEWGCWNTDHELRSPSVRIVFPTIETVKSSAQGIQLSKRLLSFSESTWQRLRCSDIFNDAIPNPAHRVGHPMHVKVARRRFQYKDSTTAFGWAYCGSHNFSVAAWGRIIGPPSLKKGKGGSISRTGLRICNYELGVILIVPPPNTVKLPAGNLRDLDDIELPFAMPAPRYRDSDRPATARAMHEAMFECADFGQAQLAEDNEEMDESAAADEETTEQLNYVSEEENAEDKIYAEMLWSQVDSSYS